MCSGASARLLTVTTFMDRYMWSESRPTHEVLCVSSRFQQNKQKTFSKEGALHAAVVQMGSEAVYR